MPPQGAASVGHWSGLVLRVMLVWLRVFLSLSVSVGTNSDSLRLEVSRVWKTDRPVDGARTAATKLEPGKKGALSSVLAPSSDALCS